MGCVNRNGKEFKALAERNDIAINTLELYTHKYWLETGNETLFPTDVYIQAQIGYSHYQEPGESVRKLWKLRYNTPQEFTSMNALQAAIREATKYFPKSAIMYHKNGKGNFVLSVKRPVEKFDYSKDDFFEEYDSLGSMKDVKVLDLGLKDHQVYGIDKVQEIYNRFNTDKTSKALADRAFNIARELGLKITFDDSLPFGIAGRYTDDNTIMFKRSFLERDMMNNKKAPIVLHEVLHALSMYVLSDRAKNWKRPEALEAFRTEMNSLYQDLKSNPMLKGERGIVDLHEFVAELANPVFREKIKNIDRENNAAQKNEKKSFWSRIIDAFKSLLGLHVTNTYYQRSMNALDKALDAFDIDTYMRYNGVKNTLRQGYNVKEWEFNSMSDNNLKTEIKSYLNKEAAKEQGITLTNIKPQYKGKLIYAQSGTGKTSVADNITVFDSDYILGQILGVSTETAGFFFKTLSSKQKEAFGQKYREAIKQKIAEGYTVVTANDSLLPDADVIVYNSSVEQTDERVNRADREINNRYHAIDYHDSTLSKIKELKENDKENHKEYHELDEDHYLADVITTISDTQYSHLHLRSNTKQKESNALLREQVISDFLNEFGITVHTLNDYDGELPLFDALNRVINAKNPSDITDGVGYAIAFMMQGDPEMQKLIVKSHFGIKGDFNKKVPIINKTLKNLHINQHSPIAKEILNEVGRQIASELKNNFGTPIEEVKSKKSVWAIIKNFFAKLGMDFIAFGKRGEVKNNEKLFVKDIISALGREDFSRIKGPRIKEGSNELAQQVDVETALKENPYEDSIIKKLGEHGIALAGSTSIALQGSLYRPSENPLHDIDFNAGNNSSKESLDKLLPTLFPNDTIQFSHALKKDKNGDQTVTYITLSEPFDIKNTGYDTAEFYSKEGRYLGKREHYDLFLEDGVQGKMLDFFTGPTQESNYGFYTKNINGHDYLLAESNAAMAAKILWARPKDMWDYKNFKRFDFINSMSGKQLRDELSVIKQESADYDLVNGVEPEHKHSGKAVPQDFTFADGTKIKAPFRPNGQQVDALNEMDRFMKSNETSMTLSGYAGTGKTSLMEMIAKKGKMQRRDVVFCATTNKAAAVLNARVSKSDFKATTLHKAFGISVAKDAESGVYNTKNLKTTVKRTEDIEIEPGSTIIIDEASMINEKNYNTLNKIAKAKGLKIIYVGDEAQLAPIGENKISKVFRNGEGKVIRLTQVERTDDNAILKEATDIRNDKPLSGESSFNSKGEGVAYITPSHQDAIDDIIGHYVKGLADNPDYFRILAYTNKSVAAYNDKVRSILGHTSPAPQVGEPMTGYSNLRYDWKTKTYAFVNSESYKVVRTEKPKTRKITLDDGTTYSMEAFPITLEDSFGKVVTFDYMDIKNNKQNRDAAEAIGRKKKDLWVKWHQTTNKQLKKVYLGQIHKLEDFLFVNDEIIDEKTVDPNTGQHPTLVDKVIDFGYAMTVHKSQGSTFTNVLIDDVDIARGTREDAMTNDMSKAMPKVDLGDEGRSATSADTLMSSEEVDLGDLGNAETPLTKTKTPDDAIDTRQQLEYVAVSRATDTVTIISNNVKKEGSPLHPENAIKEDNNRSDNKNQSNESNNTRNAETPTGEQQTSNGGLLANAQARIKRGNGDLRESQKQRVFSQEHIDKRNQEDRESLEKFAKEQGKWVNDVDTKLEKKYGKRIGHGSEAWVYRKGKDTVIKSRSLTGYETIQDALRSIELHNKLFPETAMKVVGFGESDGEFTVILEQSFVEGAFATNEDIAAFIKEKFKDTKEDPSVEGNTSYKNNKYLLQDLKPQNVIVKVVNGEKQFYVIDGDFYDNRHLLNITPANNVDKKASIKGSMANKFIGFGDGIANSSTANYAKQAGDKANTGSYSSEDVIFVSIPGKRGVESIRHEQQDRTIQESLKALNAGATLLTDNKSYTERSDYNEGEKKLAKALTDAGGVYSEIQKNGQTIGVWHIDVRKLIDINSTKNTINDQERYNDNKQSQIVINSDKTILSNEELKYWNEKGVGEMPRILTASEHTDPAFHVAEILRVLDGTKSITTWDKQTLTGKDFAGMYLITKHDGLPMKKLLETKIPKLIHFSITGLGGTAYEPGVMKYNDLLDRIQEYIKQGLDPKCVTVRVDPIVPGVTKLSDVEEIVRRASAMGIKRIRFSILDAYPNTVTALDKLGYDFETYYGKKADGKYNFYPKKEHQNTITDFMLSLKDKYGITLGTCAEPLVREGISKEGCLSVAAVNNMLGTHIEDKGTDNNGSRKLCSCYGGKVDALRYNATCASHCIYCYAKHENDKALQYYNEDGSLKDNVYTRTQDQKEQGIKTEKQPTILDQVISQLKSIGIPVRGRAAMAEFLKTHKLEYLQQYINKYDLPKGELPTLSETLMTKYGNNTAYGEVIQTANYEYTVNYKGAGEYDIIEYHEIDNNINNTINDTERKGVSGTLNRLSFRDEITERQYPCNSYNVEDREANGNNAKLDKTASQGESKQAESNDGSSQNKGWSTIKRDSATGRITFVEGDGKTISTVEDWKGMETFTTPQGEVYGFVDKDGNIYLDETKISPEHPIHEYTHLWDRTVQKKNPKLWQRGVELMKQTSLWNEILNGANYGKQWQSMNLPKEKLESLIASEVHSRLVGENGEKLLNNLAKQKGQEGIIGKLKQWILDMWKEVKATFGSWSQEELDKLTLKDFNHMTVRDFADGVNLKEAPDATYTKENTIDKEEVKTNVEQSSQAEDTTQSVNLPGYQQFKDYFEETPVDAAWKVSYLKELDAQISTENSAEENQNIITQMDNVLQATSEAEYKQEANNTKEKRIQKALDEYEKLTQQINNLLEGDEYLEEMECPLSATEVRHVAELVANHISDLITQMQKEDGAVEKMFPTLTTNLDFQKASRKEILEAVNINRLIEKTKELFDSEHNGMDNYTLMDQADVIYDNWEAIMYLAADVFAMNEGFGIVKDFSNGRFTTTENSKTDYGNFNDYSNDPDYVRENGGKDEQEHWQIESRTIDVLDSMSALVRQGLHECYLLNPDGSKVISKWGIPERVNPRDTVNSILRWTQGALSLDAMVKMLTNKQQQNPWLSQLIKRLSDTSGNETDFQSQFYNVFSKHFQYYSIVLLEDGKYHSMLVNSHPALKEAMDTITAQFKIGEHPLFTEHSIKSSLLGNDYTTGKDADFNFHKAMSEMREITKALYLKKEELDDEKAKTISDNVVAICRAFGYNITEEILEDVINKENISKMTNAFEYLVKKLDNAKDALAKGEIKSYDPFKFKGDNSIGYNLRKFLTPITERLEDTAISAFYDSGKMYQSYITPSFMTKLMNKFHSEPEEFMKFIDQEYGSSEWFRFKGHGRVKGEWRNEWLRLLAGDRDKQHARKVFDHKVELNFNKHNYMRNMSDAEYTLSLITEYFAESTSAIEDKAPSWYRVPMQSNKPSSEFIKFYSYRGEDYKKNIVEGLHKMFLQEVSRIQTVRMRNLNKKDAAFIKNFDSNGRKFCFLPVLNSYLENTDVAKEKRNVLRNADGSISEKNNRCAELLQKLIEGTEALTSKEGSELDTLIDEVITQSTEDRVQSILNKWEKGGILAAAKKIRDIYPKSLDKEKVDAYVRSQVENYLWNDSFASKNILQLTLTDISFYKDAEDLQKRLAQLHAPGNRGRVDATDYKGNRVSDGWYRTFILKDFDNFKSNIIANISEVFDKRIREAKTTERKKQLEALKDSLVRKPGTMGANDKGGKYWNINVTDAQGYSSPSSYRKKALIFGRWSRKAEEIYQKMLSGDYKYDDLETAFQPLKPFVYSKLTKGMGVDNAPITSMQVPFQAKNAEYLLIMADAFLKGEELSRPNLLRAVFRVMEDSEKFCPTKGIDTVQFESAIKSGLQGAMDIHQFREMEGGEEAAYTFMMNQIFKESYGKDADNNVVRTYKDYNTDTFVHETSYEDYCLQQEVPEHFKDHSQAHGSQIRMITPSDLDFYTTDESGNQVVNFYEWTEPDPNNKGKKIKKRLNAEDFRKEYEKTIARNIEESIADLRAELHLDSGDKREMNIALSKILQREILSSPRYGIDLVQACSVDKKTGEFRIPKGDPVQAKRIEQLINSIIKNRINKQKIAGGPIVQVSNFGTSKQLHIRFNDKQGNLMPLEEEYNPSEHDDMSYKEYCKKHQGGIAYFEVYAPIWSNELVEKFGNPDGSINIEAIEATDPDLLKMVSYRIPTEDKYSCAPMKVVGFMPRKAGDAIMLPYELTEIDDSDFDVDKRYVMRKVLSIKLDRRKAEDYLFKIASDSYKKSHNGKADNHYIGEQVRMFLDNPEKMKDADKFMQFLNQHYEYYRNVYSKQHSIYYTSAPTSGKEYRDNKIVDMTYAVLTNQMTADKILNPGGFDAPKKMGYMVAAFKSDTNNLSWDELQSKSIDDLKDLSYTDKDLTFADTQVQFYKQNSAASSLIGVFAVNKVAHATLESNDIWLDVSNPNVCGEAPFNIGGHYVEVKNPDTGEMEKKIEGGITFKGRMKVDMKYDSEGNLIGKTLGSLVSASADAVKDPILNLMNINMTTAGMLNSMLRLGMTFDDAAMFLSQNIIERMLTQFNKENLDNYVSLDEIINKWLDAYRTKHAIADTSVINSQDLTKEELIEGLTSKEHDAIDYKVLLIFQKLKNITDNMRNLTFSTRFNSISSAVGPLIVDNIILRHKMDKFLENNTDDGTHFFADANENIPVDMDDVFADHPILKQFAESVNIAEEVFADMPAGSNSFKTVLDNLPQDIADKMYGDKQLLDDFSEFYQSYLLLQSGVIDEADLKYYVSDFAKEFTDKNYKEKYPDNALIQDIRMNVNKKTGRPFLTLNITGMDEQKKERYRSAWVDLHKADPELSKQLFEYSFFRGGIGFSPKTLMSLVPTFVKERIKSKDGSASYIDTYRNFPDVEPKFVRDQFIRNNWDNNKLVPKRSAKGTHYDVDLKNGTLRVFMPNEVADTNGLSYMKVSLYKKTYLWRLNEEKSNSKEVIFDLVKPLGNNGEYLEMSLTDNKGSLMDTTQTAKEMAATSLKTDSPAESDSSNTSNNQVTTTTQTTKELDNFVDFLMKKNPELGKQAAFDMTTKSMRGKESIYGSFIQLVYEKGGLHYDKKEAISKYKEMMEEYENLC